MVAWSLQRYRDRLCLFFRMAGDVFAAWQHDDEAGKNAIMVAQQNVTVTDLNSRAQAYRMGAGSVRGGTSSLRDGLAAYRGDRIVTRVNDATLGTVLPRRSTHAGRFWLDGVTHATSLFVVSSSLLAYVSPCRVGTSGTLKLVALGLMMSCSSARPPVVSL
ncbi:hypothetical protein E3T43_13740 [Cryobacterium sp. Hh7]|uniref:hypothetical protein n=1 Tax=Cryobacterium sp. Hh7 TaxID=1259159 RepID=UPI00106A01FF|nr:hypothetical protein [Cryobacterium sp. Hh7]TFD53494.1 hypothetical protein E3T43_13740 [Cryobacterium sp. Hh7]